MQKNYLIVGGSRGIGRVLVEQLRDGNHNVWVASRSAEDLPADEIVRHLPFDVTDAEASFLLSDAASWMSGQVLHLDGGMSSLRTFS